MKARNVKGWVVSPSYVCQIGKVSNTHSLLLFISIHEALPDNKLDSSIGT